MEQISKLQAEKYDFETREMLAFTDTVICEYKFSLEVKGHGSFEFTCTPHQLEELIIGFLNTKGMIIHSREIEQINFNKDKTKAEITLSNPCETHLPKKHDPQDINMTKVLDLIKAFNIKDELFEQTGALHCCLIAVNGEVKYNVLDMGRHNAIDKAIGLALMDEIDFSQCMLLTSGRLPEEIVDKVAFAGIPILVSRSAPTKQAVQKAKKYGVRLLGFAGLKRINIY